MDSSRIPNNLLNYRPYGEKSLGRPLKGCSENCNRALILILDDDEEEEE
jgi:hypothetical protein